jgi:tight adherence protein C
MSTLLWVIVGLVLVGGAVALVVVGMRTASAAESDEDPLMARLAEFSERGETVSLEDLELSQPFSERVIVPILRAIGDLSARFTPQKLIEQTELKMELAGNPIKIDAATFLASRFVVAVLFDSSCLVVYRAWFCFSPALVAKQN